MSPTKPARARSWLVRAYNRPQIKNSSLDLTHLTRPQTAQTKHHGNHIATHNRRLQIYQTSSCIQWASAWQFKMISTFIYVGILFLCISHKPIMFIMWEMNDINLRAQEDIILESDSLLTHFRWKRLQLYFIQNVYTFVRSNKNHFVLNVRIQSKNKNSLFST